MKEICPYNCSSQEQYRTPWCSLLQSCGCSSGEILHLWYKLDLLRDEVAKRSAYLGKFRRTEEAAHLLDLIKMTRDEDNLFVPFAKAAMADVFDALNLYAPEHEKAYFWREGRETIVINDEESKLDPAIAFYAGDYVLYNGDLCMAIEDGTSDDVAGKLLPTEDYRDSIHYGILWKCCGSNINMVEPLDTAIFEALVARIIYKWLQYSYPDEAPRYLNEWNECMAQIQTRVRRLDGPKIVNRIPRIF